MRVGCHLDVEWRALKVSMPWCAVLCPGEWLACSRRSRPVVSRPIHRSPTRLQNIKEALRRTPRDVLDARMQRMKRAMDLSMKHSVLPEDLQSQQTPFEFYLQDTIKEVEAEELERSQLGAGRSIDRQIP